MHWGWASMHERSERLESPGTYVTERVSRCHFCLALCSFGLPSHALVVIIWRGVRGWMLLHDAVGIKCEKGTTWIPRHRCQVYGQWGVCWWLCVLSDLQWLPILGGGRKSWYIIITIWKIMKKLFSVKKNSRIKKQQQSCILYLFHISMRKNNIRMFSYNFFTISV